MLALSILLLVIATARFLGNPARTEIQKVRLLYSTALWLVAVGVSAMMAYYGLWVGPPWLAPVAIFFIVCGFFATCVGVWAWGQFHREKTEPQVAA